MTEKELVKPANTIAVLQKYGLSPQKKFGQNFLIDEHVLEKIIEAAQVGKDDLVLEIGPGIGTMTERLSEAASEVIAVEIDRNLIPVLSGNLSGRDNVRIIHADILEMNLKELFEKEKKGRKIRVVANLPYYITTPIVMRLLEEKLPIDSITVMVQKEVAERMQAEPGNKSYGAISLAVAYYAKAEIAAHVPPNCFIPRPGVGSAVITLSLYDTPSVSVKDETYLFQVIRASFRQRRKTLVNSLSHAPELGITKEDAAEALKEEELSEQIRGEVLTLKQFAALSERLLKRRRKKHDEAR